MRLLLIAHKGMQLDPLCEALFAMAERPLIWRAYSWDRAVAALKKHHKIGLIIVYGEIDSEWLAKMAKKLPKKRQLPACLSLNINNLAGNRDDLHETVRTAWQQAHPEEA